jgi:thioredoxin 1
MKLSQITFYDLLKSSDKPVLADFYSGLTGPTTLMNSEVREVVGEFSEEITVVRIDLKKNSTISSMYKVSSTPSLMFLTKGEVVWQKFGWVEPAELKRLLDESLSTQVTIQFAGSF